MNGKWTDKDVSGKTGKWIVWDTAPGISDRPSVGRIIDMDDPIVRACVTNCIANDPMIDNQD